MSEPIGPLDELRELTVDESFAALVGRLREIGHDDPQALDKLSAELGVGDVDALASTLERRRLVLAVEMLATQGPAGLRSVLVDCFLAGALWSQSRG